MPTDIARIRADAQQVLELEAKATPGPWMQGNITKGVYNLSRVDGLPERILSQWDNPNDGAITIESRNRIARYARVVIALCDAVEACRECAGRGTIFFKSPMPCKYCAPYRTALGLAERLEG